MKFFYRLIMLIGKMSFEEKSFSQNVMDPHNKHEVKKKN